MKEELIRDNSTYNADRQALKDLLDYAQSSLAVAEQSMENSRDHLDDDFVVNFTACAKRLFMSQLETTYYRQLAGVITDEDAGVADVRAYLQRREHCALDRLTEPRLSADPGSLINVLERMWALEFLRFDYTESERLLQKYLNVNPE